MSDRFAWVRRRRRLWGGLLLTGITLFCGVYGWGVVFGGHLTPLRPDEICGFLRGPNYEVLGTYHRTFLPLSYRCTNSDGYSHERVPSFVNPTLVIVAALCAILATLWIAARWWAWRESRSTYDWPHSSAD